MNDLQFKGRARIKTDYEIIGNPQIDILIIKKILKESLVIHNKNCADFEKLFSIFYNDMSYWKKEKGQRSDINNKITIPNAWALTRTINGYCFGEPIKYVARNSEKQDLVELYSNNLDSRQNHNSTMCATMTASICGIGYKLALPSPLYEEIPFVINDELIKPENAFVVYTNTVISQKIMGVFIGKHQNKKQYTVWTKTHQYIFVEDNDNSELPFKILMQTYNGELVDAYPLVNREIPLIEFERNAFRKGDWEVAVDLLTLKNKLISNRADDIEQVIDYVLVLYNCKFEDEANKKTALKDRLIELMQKDPQAKPSLEILKNALDQSGVQMYSDYIDLLIQETVGIPNRQERGGGGGDTGAAVKYRNGFRDLENNAGIILPKADKAEAEFTKLCLSYCHNRVNSPLKALNASDVRNKFLRTLNDDIISTSQSYATFRNAGMNDVDALMLSKAGTDPSEIAKKNKDAMANGELLFQIQNENKALKKPENKNQNDLKGGA